MPKIKAVIAAGVEPAEAVKAALGMTIREFAELHRVSESAVSGVIHGSTPYLYARVRDALARHLEVDRAYIDEILPPPRRPKAGAARREREPRARPPAAEPRVDRDPGSEGGDAFDRVTAPGLAVAGDTDRRGRQEQRAMHTPARTPAPITRPATAGIAQSARDWLRLADPLAAAGPDLGCALATLMR